jgi:hypothetical protein
MEESDGNPAGRGVGASAGRGISDVVPQPELGLHAQRRIGRGAADRAPARLVGAVVSRREPGRITGSEDEPGWIGTPEEMLDALLNRPAPLSPVASVQSALDQPSTGSTEVARSIAGERSVKKRIATWTPAAERSPNEAAGPRLKIR